MANHVYFTINISTNEEGEKAFDKALVTQTSTYKDWEGKPREMEELSELHTLPFMPEAELDEEGFVVNSWDYYCDNVGAKWCNIEDWSSDWLSGYSAWSPPSQMCENIIKYLMKFDPNVSLKMTYEDEFRNFVGKLWIDAADGEISIDEEEMDGDEITDQVAHQLGLEEIPEDFEWGEEFEMEDGNTVYPYEVSDDIVYAFFEE